jgi:hypothetical protein
MESIEIRRRVQGLRNAAKCSICGEVNFRASKILNLDCTICNVCGHIDFFEERHVNPSDENSSNQTISNG